MNTNFTDAVEALQRDGRSFLIMQFRKSDGKEHACIRTDGEFHNEVENCGQAMLSAATGYVEDFRDSESFSSNEVCIGPSGPVPEQGTNWWRIFLFVILFFNFIAGLGYIFKFVK